MGRPKKEDLTKVENVQAENVQVENVQNENVQVKEEKKVQEEKQVIEGSNIVKGEVVKSSYTKEYSNKGTVVVCLNYPTPIIFRVSRGDAPEHDVKFMGNGSDLMGKSQGILSVGGYGMTPNVDIKDWQWIKENYPDLGLIKSGLLFATEARTARDEAVERTNLRNGYEPRDPNDIDGQGKLAIKTYDGV